VYVPLGQAPVLRDVYASILRQLTNGGEKELGGTPNEVRAALSEAASGKRVLLILDDAWSKELVSALDVLDARTASCLFVTTRLKALLPDATELELGPLPLHDAVRLMLEVAGEKYEPDLVAESPLYHQAAEACGCLPLVLSIAGGILEQHGSVVDEAFVKLITEEKDETLLVQRAEGEHGDEMVSIEDRLITTSLSAYQGADKQQVFETFLLMAVFPEDVPIPAPVMDALAPLVAGRDAKRATLKARSWLTALIRCSLCKGSVAGGVYLHDIVRHFTIVQHTPEELATKQQSVVQQLLGPEMRNSGGLFEHSAFAEYMQSYLFYHVEGATGGVARLENASFLRGLLEDREKLVGAAAVMALGVDNVRARAEELAEGEPVHAALWLLAEACVLHGGQASSDMNHEAELLSRASDLLTSDDDELSKLPKSFLIKYSEMLGRLGMLAAVAGIDNTTLAEKQAKLEPLLPPSWQGLSNKFMAEVTPAIFKSGVSAKDWDGAKYTPAVWQETVDTVYSLIHLFPQTMELAKAEPQPALRRNQILVTKAVCQFIFNLCRDLFTYATRTINPSEFFATEREIEEVLAGSSDELHALERRSGSQTSEWFCGVASVHLALFSYGAVDVAIASLSKIRRYLAPPEKRDAQAREQHLNSYAFELVQILHIMPTAYVTVSMRAEIIEFVRDLGLATELTGGDDAAAEQLQAKMLILRPDLKPGMALACLKLAEMHGLSEVGPEWQQSPAGQRFVAWMPSPGELEAYDRSTGWFCTCVWHTYLEMGMLAYERLDDQPRVVECAERILALHRKAQPRVEAYRCLARVERLAGAEAQALELFARAREEALKGRLSFCELLIGRDCGGVEGEEMIESALHALKKPRDAFDRLGVPPKPACPEEVKRTGSGRYAPPQSAPVAQEKKKSSMCVLL